MTEIAAYHQVDPSSLNPNQIYGSRMRQHDVARSTISLRRLSNTVHAESTELISSFLGELSTLLVYGSYFFASHRPFMSL